MGAGVIEAEIIPRPDSQLWQGSFNGRESTLQQLSPYVGKMKSGMARILLTSFSERGDVVLGGYCVLVLGDVNEDDKTYRTAEALSSLATEVTHNQLITDGIYDDVIPDDRRSRRKTRTTHVERILVMRKR